MRQAFIRAIWGFEANVKNNYHTRDKILKEIELHKKCKYQQPFIVYCWGTDNYNFIDAQKIPNCTLHLVSPNPSQWPNEIHWRHKLEVFKLAMKEYDEIVFLDWDTFPIAPLPTDFWDTLRKGSAIKASLIKYKIGGRSSPYWRNTNKDLAVGAAWVYMRDKTIPDGIIKTWEDLGRNWSEEQALTKYLDDRGGGWKGRRHYLKTFEPIFFYHHRGQATRPLWPGWVIKNKRTCFRHMGIVGPESRTLDIKSLEWLNV